MSKNKIENDEETTPEDRLKWLRERGVIVETAEDRKSKNSISQNNELSGNYENISYVYIPHDTSKQMKEMKLRVYEEYKTAGDILPDHLKALFGVIDSNNATGKASVDLTLFHEHATQQNILGSKGVPGTISDATMRKLAEEGQVEIFNLVKPVPSNKFINVNIYLDEVGMLKRLPLNSRAIDLAGRAGFNPPPTFYGDVFVGRVATKPRITNIDFKLGVDTATDAKWIINATMENLEYQTKMNQITGKDNDIHQPLKAGEDGIAKEEEGYQWTQTDEEVEIVVNLKGEKSNATSKEVKVEFRPTYVQVKVRGNVTLRVDLFARIDPDGCTWTLDRAGDQLKLMITCEKSECVSWPRVTF